MLAPQLHQRLRECPIAMIPNEQAHREYRLPATAVQFQAALWPVREALAAAEGRRMHRSKLFLEQMMNKRIAPLMTETLI